MISPLFTSVWTKRRFPAVPLFILALFLLSSASRAEDADSLPGPPPGDYHLTSESGEVKIPFEIYRGDIRYQGKVNGHDVHLLLDDGFLWDQLLFWGGPAVDSLGLEYDGVLSVGGGSDDSEGLQSRTASGITLSLPGVEFTNQTAVITPAASGNASMWAGSVGQVSCTFFKHFVVDINFDNMVITLIPRDKFEYKGNGVEIPWGPNEIGTRQIPGALELEDGRLIEMNFLMHLGYNNQLQLVLGGDHNITLPCKTRPTSLGANIQGVETRGYIGRLKGVKIGGYEVRDVVVGFVAEEHTSHALTEAMIGLGLLSRFNLVLDFYNQRMFVEPNHGTDDPYEIDMTGLAMRGGEADCFEILAVYPDSPAEEAGLKPGDRVHTINGRKATDWDYFELRPLLRRESTTVALDVERDGHREKVELKLRRLL